MKSHVLIMTHLAGNHPYLLRALEGHLKSKGAYPITVISSADQSPDIRDPRIKVVHDQTLNTTYLKIKAFLSLSTEPYFLIQSDDVIVSPNIIESMEDATANAGCPTILTPFSNNEEGSRFIAYSTPWMKDRDQTVVTRPNPDISGTGMVKALLPVEWFAFYCVYMPRAIYESMPLDPALEYRYNDVDFCLRARKVGVLPAINLGCLAYHYGSATLKKIVTPEMYQQADVYWQNKLKNEATE